jgi:hypothetical protein
MWSTVRVVVIEGLELMTVDVAVQLSLTCTIYVAATTSFEMAYKVVPRHPTPSPFTLSVHTYPFTPSPFTSSTFTPSTFTRHCTPSPIISLCPPALTPPFAPLCYQLSAAQAAYWVLGPQYLVGSMYVPRWLEAGRTPRDPTRTPHGTTPPRPTGPHLSARYVLKLFGSKLIARGELHRFCHTYAFVLYIACAMAVGAVVTSCLKRTPLSYVYGQSACIYATSAPCATAYAHIFGDGDAGSDSADSLSQVFEAFGPTVHAPALDLPS